MLVTNQNFPLSFKVNKDNCVKALSPDMLATDIAYYLTKKGVSIFLYNFVTVDQQLVVGKSSF